MSGPSARAVRPRVQSIIHPVVDLLCVGGLSILVIVPLLVSGREDLAFIGIPALAWTQSVINYSHFMASYRIIYRDRATILRHKWASIGIPLFLVLACVVAFWQEGLGRPEGLALLVAGASAYLAWHYTGQAWGMMASYTYLGGDRFEKGERVLIRGSLRVLLIWHVVWFAKIWVNRPRLDGSFLEEPFWLTPLYQAASVAAVIALLVGAAGIGRFWLRTRHLPPARALVAWLATFVWYAALARWGLPALFLVQVAHAIQYIEFPARVEFNRATRNAAGRAAVHMAGYVVLLLLISFVVVLLVPGPAMSVVAGLLGTEPSRAGPVLLMTFINIHHYFTDGVAWKISNPQVRKELFAHVQPAGTQAPGAATKATGKAKR